MPSSRSTFVFLSVLLFLVALPIIRARVYAQIDTASLPHIPTMDERPDLWAEMQDSSWNYLVVAGDTLAPNMVAPAYYFDMLEDSLCRITYSITEWQRNGVLLRLPTWIQDRRVNAPARLLSFNSTTDTFTCAAGDTLSFFRQIQWRDPRINFQDTGNYYSLDSLDYAVELVRASDSARITVLDSIGMLSCFTPGQPRIHGTRPIAAIVKFPVPVELDGVRAFMRLLVYCRGNGTYWFIRHDDITLGLSRCLDDTNQTWYWEMFGEGSPFYKAQLLESLEQPVTMQRYLDVRFPASSHSDATITFDSAPDGGATAVSIYDASGRALFYPIMTPASTGRAEVRYTFQHGGMFFVGLLHNGRLVASRKVAVTR